MNNARTWWVSLGVLAFLFLIYSLSSILTPFFIAALLAYLGNPVVNHMVLWKVPRTLAVVIVFVIFVLFIVLLLLLLIPLLERQIIIFIDWVPQLFSWIQAKILPLLAKHTDIQSLFNIEAIKNLLATHWQQAGNIANTIFQAVTKSGHTLFAFGLNLLLIPVVAFYLLRDWNTVVAGALKLIPRAVEPTIAKLAAECNEVLGAFFRGQLIVMLCLGIFYSLGLTLAGLNIALLLGMIIGIISIVPYLGFIVGIAIALIAAYMQFQDWAHLVYVIIVFISGNVIESAILTPLLVGDRIGLHPVAVIFAILAGGQLFGFIGILLALPAAAVIMVWVRYLSQRYMQSKFYQPRTAIETAGETRG